MEKTPKQDGIIKPTATSSGQKSHIRRNPMGHTELVIARKGKKSEGTLNELSVQLMELLEEIAMSAMPALSAEQLPNERATNQPFTPQLVSSGGDQTRANGDAVTNMRGSTPLASPSLDVQKSGKKASGYRSTSGRNQNYIMAEPQGNSIDVKGLRESMTGTAGIAIAPMGYNTIEPTSKKRKTRKPTKMTMEYSDMRNEIDRLLNEWEPEFVAGDYDPGQYKMDHLGGSGVTSRRYKKHEGSDSLEMMDHGDPFGADHHETAAMCDVDEDGVEHESQGGHESTSGDPLGDDCCDEVGHNWPDQPRHKGGGVAEPVKGRRYADGGVLTSRSTPDGGVSESKWSPAKIGGLMGSDINVRALFENYARTTKAVHLEGFTQLCEAHGSDVILDQTSLLKLMANNRQYMFHEHRDADGTYWLKEEMDCDSDSDIGLDLSLDIDLPGYGEQHFDVSGDQGDDDYMGDEGFDDEGDEGAMGGEGFDDEGAVGDEGFDDEGAVGDEGFDDEGFDDEGDVGGLEGDEGDIAQMGDGMGGESDLDSELRSVGGQDAGF